MAMGPRETERDPIRWCWAIAAVFAALVSFRLGTPSKIMFDEVHYVPAARALLKLTSANPEHPLLGKEAIAAAIWLLGDRAWVWRLPSAIMGVVGLFAFGRAVWWASGRRFASIAGQVLLATDFVWFVQSRIAMLDMVMAGVAMVGLWLIAAAVCKLGGVGARRARVAGAGVAFGLAIAAKWSAVPILAVIGIGFAAIRWRNSSGGGRAAGSGLPMRGISLAEAAWWLGSVPCLVYWASFAPAFFYRTDPLAPLGVLRWQRNMLALQASVTRAHPYQTHWWQWVIDERGIWYLYEVVDGIQRGVLMLGNPLTMLAGLPALGWCVWAAWQARAGERRWDAVAVVALYVASLAMWMVPGKPVQFYYHYLLPGSFVIAALALALDKVWRGRSLAHWLAPATLAGSVGMFGWFWPILSAAPLHGGAASFERWMWLASWR